MSLRRGLVSVIAFLVASLWASAPEAEQSNFLEDQTAFFEHVTGNPVTADAVWLEMLNARGEWEKVVLVFGFAGRGDFAACEDLRGFAANQNPNRDYRCNPVN